MRTIEFKLYPTATQEATLNRWLGTCCWIHNQMLEGRIKSYKRRKESQSFYSQCALLTEMRSRIESLDDCPIQFLRGSLRRVDLGMKAFFRRCKAGEKKPGFPRFKSGKRFNSLESLESRRYARDDGKCFIPKIGLVRMRAGNQSIPKEQKLFRVIRRASGWFGQVLVDDAPKPVPAPTESAVGIDVGLHYFASLSTGEHIANPRFARSSARKLRSVQRSLARKVKGSMNRRKAVRRVARVHEKIAAQRKNFCHQESRKIVNRFGSIAVEKLNVSGMARGHFAKSILDAAWSMFTTFTGYKAASADRRFKEVDARRTSQECPDCGRIQKKNLNERVHRCPCGCVECRDVAASRVILSRAKSSWRDSPVDGSTNIHAGIPHGQVGQMKQEVLN